MKWIQDDTNSRLKYLEPLVSKINLNLLSLEGLKKIKNDLFMTAGLVQKIDEIITYKTAKGLKMHVIDLGETISYHNVRHEAERAVSISLNIVHRVENCCFSKSVSILGDICYWWRIQWNSIAKRRMFHSRIRQMEVYCS